MNRKGKQDPEATELLGKAMAAAKAAISKAENDPARPVFHYRAPAQWMNDPNGPIFYRGWYHLFYQFNPYGDQWGHMHWGHARSRDLVNWEELPIAIWPTKSQGEDHVYSGSTFLDAAGLPRIFYTSISGQRTPEQWTAIPLDRDLFRWQKPDVNPVVSEATHAPTKIDEWRDPFLFTMDGHTYMLTGGIHEDRGVVVGYRAQNGELTEWEYVGIVYKHPSRRLIECPNLAQIGDHWVLFYYLDGQFVESQVGQFAPVSLEFIPEHTRPFLSGGSASQLVQGKDDQWNYLAWLNMNHHVGWNGTLGLPNVLSVDDEGTLRGHPIKALDRLRGEKTSIKGKVVDGELDLAAQVKGNTLEVQIEILPQSAKEIAIHLSGTAVATYEVETRTLTLPHRTPVVLRSTENAAPLKLRLYLDRTIMDVYADDYTQLLTSTIALSDQGLKITTEGGPAKVLSLNAWQMNPAKFDLSRYQ